MDHVRQFLKEEEGEEDYFRALKLTDEDAKRDPVTEPYRSMYEARKIWLSLKTRVDNQANENVATKVDYNYLSAALDLKIGMNFSDTEEKSTGEEHLRRCIEKLEGVESNERACNVAQIALNQLGIVTAETKGAKPGLDCLIRAELLHGKYVETVGSSPWTVDDLFRVTSYPMSSTSENGHEDGNDEKEDERMKLAELEKAIRRRTESFEDVYTYTLYFLAQVYEKMGETSMSASYCHETLRRQVDSHKYNPLDWSMHAATLAQYYFAVNKFALSRHCLASAEFVLKETGDRPASLFIDPSGPEGDDAGDESLSARERVPKAWADLCRCWSNYGLAVLAFSQDRLYKALDEEDGVSGKKEVEKAEEEDDKDGDRRLYFNLELTAIESQITDQPVCIFSEAREVFLRVQSWLTIALDFYRIDGHCSDHIEIVRDHSTLYKLLAFFESDLERQCKMHKRRADLLSAVLAQLNPQFYLLVCRQLMFELAEIYSAMLDNKLAIIEVQAGSPVATPGEHSRKKINALTRQSIDKFQEYIDSLKVPPERKLPEQFQEDDERPALAAHFYVGRLYSKFMDRDVSARLVNIKHSLDFYTFIVEYCRRNPSAVAKVKTERDICEEMTVLLPAKMDKLRAEMEM